MIPSAAEFRRALAAMVDSRRSVPEARMRDVFAEERDLKVLDHYSLNVDTGSLPVLCMEQIAFRFAWVAAPSIARVSARVKLWGFVWHEDPRKRDDLAAEFAAGVLDVCNARHLTYPLNETTTMYFDGDGNAPVGAVEYGGIAFGSSVLGGWTAEWRADAELQVIPKNP